MITIPGISAGLKALARAFVLTAVAARAVAAAPAFTQREREARFYYDLGPDAVDVSSYPARIQADYAVFSRACARCHSLARPLNAPIVSRRAWGYYVFRMRLRGKDPFGTFMSEEEERAAVDFLAFDSKVRKISRRAEFEALAERLQNRFDMIIRERMSGLQRASRQIRP